LKSDNKTKNSKIQKDIKAIHLRNLATNKSKAQFLKSDIKGPIYTPTKYKVIHLTNPEALTLTNPKVLAGPNLFSCPHWYYRLGEEGCNQLVLLCFHHHPALLHHLICCQPPRRCPNRIERRRVRSERCSRRITKRVPTNIRMKLWSLRRARQRTIERV
jgi:hypothetical protein